MYLRQMPPAIIRINFISVTKSKVYDVRIFYQLVYFRIFYQYYNSYVYLYASEMLNFEDKNYYFTQT